MNINASLVAIYPTQQAAERAVKTLGRSGFDLQRVAIIGRDFGADASWIGNGKLSARIVAWGKTGALWGALWGFLFGPIVFWAPDLSQPAAAQLVAWALGALEGALVLGAMSVLVALVFGPANPDAHTARNSSLRTGLFVLLATGPMPATAMARAILHRSKAPEAWTAAGEPDPATVIGMAS